MALSLIRHCEIYFAPVTWSPQQDVGSEVGAVERGPAVHKVALRGREELGQDTLPEIIDSDLERIWRVYQAQKVAILRGVPVVLGDSG
jgi:hypothetical protein